MGIKKKNKGLTGRRENGCRRGLREREGEVHRREPDLGAVLQLPIAARTCTKEASQSSCNRNVRGRDHPTPPPNRAVPQRGKEGRPTSLPRHPSGVEEGSAESCTRVLEFRRRKRERGRRPAGRREMDCVRGEKSGRRRSTLALGLMEQTGSAPHVSGWFQESADIIE